MQKVPAAPPKKNTQLGLAMLAVGTALLGFLPILGIIIGNELVFSSFLRDPNSVFRWMNTWNTFPVGVFTAIFVPDTPVLLGKISWNSWFFLTAGSLTAFYSFFALTNFNLEAKVRTLRFIFCVAMVFLLAFAGNVAGLFWYKQTAGPSGALYGLEGLTYGFAFLNAVMLHKKGMHFLRSFLRSFQNFLPLVLGLAIVIVIPIVAVIDPVDFFTLSIQGVKVAGGVHLFCFFTGIATSLIFGFVTSGKSELHSAYTKPLVQSKSAQYLFHFPPKHV